jgi:16S rRNA (adenine1518-N6/adenine1519-N6)-dimethyltransferase
MHIRPIKRLGQSFLTYEPAADRIVAALGLRPDDEVLEIGPGKGILTRRLVQQCRKVTAVEIDARLIAYLRTENRDTTGFRGENGSVSIFPNLELIRQDVLTLDLGRFCGVKVCGNLPYNISSQIMFRLLENLPAWQFGVFTLQREFAQRVLAEPGTKDYAALSVLFELDTERRKLFNLAPENFKPRPDVVSTVLSLRRRPGPRLDLPDREFFTRVVKAAFAHRRKTLGNNLAAGLGVARAQLPEIERAAGIKLNRRAETLTIEEFGRLSATIADCRRRTYQIAN